MHPWYAADGLPVYKYFHLGMDQQDGGTPLCPLTVTVASKFCRGKPYAQSGRPQPLHGPPRRPAPGCSAGTGSASRPY